jgi:opacity protein-like surface antigen
MNYKDMAAIAVSGILICTWAATAKATSLPTPNLELAGADDPDKATSEQLRRANQQMIPAENLKKAEPKSLPSATMKPAEDADKMPAKATPAAATKPAKTAMPKMTQQQMARAGFYIRGDIGYSLAMDPDGSTSAGAMTNESVDSAVLIGGGLGYRLDDHFRADLTVDFRPDADIEATTAGGTAVTSELNGWSLMVNGYWDADTFNNFTPYIGAGIGYARLDTSDQVGGNTETGATNNNLAWALMLGLTINAGLPDTSIDLGYRFINLGEFEQSGGASYDELMAHELRAGLRFQF